MYEWMAKGKLMNIWKLLVVVITIFMGITSECAAYNWNKSLVGLHGVEV
jgi:hypothetical protein